MIKKLILLLAFFFSIKVNAQLEKQLIAPVQIPISLKVKKDGISIQSTENEMLKNCLPYIAYRISGEKEWREIFAKDITSIIKEQKAYHLKIKLEKVKADVFIKKLDPYTWEFSGKITNMGPQPIDLLRFHYLNGEIKNQKLNFLSMSGSLTKPTDTLPAPGPATEKMWNNFGVTWPRLTDPILEKKNMATSRDCGIFTSSYQKPGWFMGFTGPGNAFGEIGFKTNVSPSQFYSAVMLDNIKLEAGETRQLEKFIVMYGDWQNSLKKWAEITAASAHIAKIIKPITGYCSWYQYAANIKMKDLDRAIEEVSALPIPPGGRMVQIDDGFQVMPGDWGPNEKFKNGWEKLPEKIKKSGSMAGFYLVPTAIHETHPIVKEHPDWLQRLKDGSPAISFSNWADYNKPIQPEKKTSFNT